ncbi:hypothetical protein A1O3_00512 [Capronia epimyces CBS 606.96]|uniref:Transcription factor domain-containing protein n=1 Tax=Capronia epimyces CBS 606.96 TaxID=1182542 RepID=W9YGF1_9EURO|nr:uncharacterized protein A1O3_00512 [Capronia epimyces CBS 606.96]EXJ91962.1 hypothetical protein A1O3_00512 [Capronia epimyces CBS 606.96]
MARPLLEFVNVAPFPGDKAQTALIRRQVRSHAAFTSHATRAAAAGSDTEGLGPHALQKPGHRKRRRHLTWTFEIRQDEEVDEQEQESVPRDLAHQSSDSALLTSLSGAPMIPASTSPVYHQPFVSVVLHNYLQHLAVAIPEIDGEGRPALLRTRWFPMVINSPVIFQVIVLFSASHYAAQRQDMAFAPTILSLKQCALRGIMQSLSASKGLARDELIAATAKMASYEAIWGEEQAYHCHMRGVEEMLRGRGGLQTLGLDGFLSRLLIFIDTNSAFLLNTHLHLQDSSFPRLEPFILPNLSRFIGEVE